MTGWKNAAKTVAIARHHRVHCASVDSTFVAPPLPDEVRFSRYRLMIAIGRSLAMRTASRRLIKSLARGRSPLLHDMVDDAPAALRLSEEVRDLNDTALANLSHDIGVGVSGLYMHEMGFTWCANGKELLDRGMRFPDYVWDTAVPAGGVVLSEAKGATAADTTFRDVDGRARDGFFKQVEPRIGSKTTKGHDIMSGYAFGVFAAGGEDACAAAWEAMDMVGTAVTPPGSTPSVSILRSHFGGVFRLLGLDDEEAFADLAESRMRFAVFGDRRLAFLVPEHKRQRLADPVYRAVRFDTAMMPALELSVADRALGLLLEKGESVPDDRVPFPRFQPHSDGLPRGVLALAPDGLAIVSNRAGRGPTVIWKPGFGFVPAD